MRTPASGYCDHLNALLGDAQWSGEYLGVSSVCVGENGYFFYLRDEGSDEECERYTPPPQRADRGDLL